MLDGRAHVQERMQTGGLLKSERFSADAEPFYSLFATSILPSGAKLTCIGFDFDKWFGVKVVDWFSTVKRVDNDLGGVEESGVPAKDVICPAFGCQLSAVGTETR